MKGLIHFQKATLRKLKERADKAYSRFRSGNPTSNAIVLAGQSEGGNDELALFGGQTRVIVSKLLSSRSPKGTQPQSASQSPSAKSSWDGDSSFVSAEQMPDVHPALMEYVSSFSSEYFDNNSTIQPPDSHHQLDIATVQQRYATQEKQTMQNSWPASSNFMDFISYSTSKLSSSTPLFTPFEPQSEPELGMTGSREDFYGGNVFELGMITSDTGMDEQWISFMRDTGLLDGGLLVGSGV